MPIFQRPVTAVARQVAYHPAPAARYVPPVRTVYAPGRTVYRDRFVPGATVTRNVYVNRGFSPDQRRAFEDSARRREFDRLMREGRWSREQAQAQAAALAAQQAAAQAAAIAAQGAAANAQAQAAAGLQPAQPGQNPSAAVSPGSPGADLGPAQDQAAADAGGGGGGDGGGGGGDDTGHKPHHLALYVGLVAVAGVVGYMVVKKKKKSKPSAD